MRPTLTHTLLALALALLLQGCSCGGTNTPDGGTDAGVDAGTDLWTAWSEISTQLALSPDNLPARADALVAGKDATKIFEFIRDAVATYPPSATGFAGAVTAQRWGAKGTLRGGAGTPREKAELLVSLYQRAGFTAEVVTGTADPAKLDGKKVLLRAADHRDTFSYTEAQAARWKAALGVKMPLPSAAIDPMGTEAAALAASLKAQLPTTLTAGFDFTLTEIPLVKVTVSGAEKFANPLAPGAAFGDALTLATPVAAPAADALPTVRVRLQAARADDAYNRFDLLDTTFAADDVVGRRIQVGFVPPVGVRKLVGLRVKDIDMVVPVVAVAGADLTQADQNRLAKAGDLLSLGGDRYALVDGGLELNGERLPPLDTDPASLAKVASVQVSANGSSYPRVSLAVSALDDGGVNLPRLGGAAFKVEEGGTPVSFDVRRLELKPKVVLLFDASSSIPAEFAGAGAVNVSNQIVQQLYAAHPDAQLKVATMNFGAAFASPSWATTLAEAQAQVQTLATATGNSDVWSALDDVEHEKPTVIIMVTDGDATDLPEASHQAALASGAPVLSIAVGTVKQATLDQVSALSGGRSVPATLAAEAVAAVNAELSARAREDYLLSYRAPTTGPATRQVKVTVNGKSATASYVVPASPVIASGLSGVYLTTVVGGVSHTVTLAGFGGGASTAFPVITQAMLEDVRGQLLGGISLSVEGAAPAQSLLLSEWIASRLALRPLYEATEAKDAAKITAALEKGFSFAPPRLALSQARLPGASSATSLTFETGLRVAAVIQKLSLAGPSSRQLDLFPLTQWATANADARGAWEQTLASTAGLAVIEKHLLSGTSTLESLEGKSLTLLAPDQASAQAGLSPEEQLAWAGLTSDYGPEYKLLVPLKPGAFWAIHQPTGTVIGVLPDGTGGGGDSCGNYDAANSAAQALGLIGSLFGASVGPWVALAEWEIKYITIADIVIGGGELNMGDPGGLNNPATDMACGAFDDALGNFIPAYGAASNIIGSINVINPDHPLPSYCGAFQTSGPCH